MKLSKLHILAASFFVLASTLSIPANANYVFSGSGTSGTFTGQAAEPWILNNDTPFNNWGSPGVSASVTPYLETDSAFGLDLVFSGVGAIDPASIALGNISNCTGSGGGGTTLCGAPFGPTDFWQAFLTGVSSISFRAQNPGQVLNLAETFFVNVFFDNDTAPVDFSFTGVWITEFAPNPVVPIPAALPLFAGGVGLLGWMARRKKRISMGQELNAT